MRWIHFRLSVASRVIAFVWSFLILLVLTMYTGNAAAILSTNQWALKVNCTSIPCASMRCTLLKMNVVKESFSLLNRLRLTLSRFLKCHISKSSILSPNFPLLSSSQKRGALVPPAKYLLSTEMSLLFLSHLKFSYMGSISFARDLVGHYVEVQLSNNQLG
jgi:hypothetical protein